mmetsp:Transcript_21570/g.24082  ORF Transcript_21570/g.24082 Transcript_21570/m.24082 type:complete len:201 (+) Transcript_21570:240-842(+)
MATCVDSTDLRWQSDLLVTVIDEEQVVLNRFWGSRFLAFFRFLDLWSQDLQALGTIPLTISIKLGNTDITGGRYEFWHRCEISLTKFSHEFLKLFKFIGDSLEPEGMTINNVCQVDFVDFLFSCHLGARSTFISLSSFGSTLSTNLLAVITLPDVLLLVLCSCLSVRVDCLESVTLEGRVENLAQTFFENHFAKVSIAHL